jgi:hypothetical protein
MERGSRIGRERPLRSSFGPRMIARDVVLDRRLGGPQNAASVPPELVSFQTRNATDKDVRRTKMRARRGKGTA